MMSDESLPSARLVRDLMKVGVPTCSPDTPVPALARLFVDLNYEAIVVLSPEDGHAIGIVSQQELVAAFSREGGRGLTAGDIMREEVSKAPADIPLEAAAQIMLDTGVRVLFQTHHAGGIEYPAAMLTFNHLLRHLAAQSDEELSDLGIQARREAPLEAYFKRRKEARARHIKTDPTKP
ncbi:MAG: CBS domain-containing protein [Anaerolineales bacterium]|jgi:predicted transcriptional regulator